MGMTLRQLAEFNEFMNKEKIEAPIIKEFTQYDVITILTEARLKVWEHHSKFDDDIDFEVDKAIEDIAEYLDKKINALMEASNEN